MSPRNAPRTSSPLWIAAGLALGLAMTAAACESDRVEPPPGGGSGGSGGAPGGSGGRAGAGGGTAGSGGAVEFVCGFSSLSTPACIDCVDDHCCEQAAACAQNPDCPPFMDCLNGCEREDTDCFLACEDAYPLGIFDGGPLQTCEQRNCTTECGHPADTTCGFELGGDECNACGQAHCCELGYQRNLHPETAPYFACVGQCDEGDTPCIIDCIGQYPGAYTAHSLFIGCLSIECADECESQFEFNLPCGIRSPDTGDKTCDGCTEASCCDAIGELTMSQDFAEFVACYYTCDADAECERTCLLQHLEGAGLNDAVYGCVGANCYAECIQALPWLGPCGNIISIDPVCNLCMQGACCDAYTALGVSPDGMSFLSCVNNTGTDAEYAQCIVDFPDGHVLSELADSCRYDYCAPECQTTPPPCGKRYDALPDCGTCIENSCCAESHDCANDFDCSRLELCRVLNGCADTDTACIDACRAQYPHGVALFDAIHACRVGVCASDCAGW